MKKMIIVTTVMAIALLTIIGSAPFVSAQSLSRVTGGGTVAPTETTQFGFGVTGTVGGAARGSFTCLMAGLFPGAPGFIPCPGDDCVMIVKGKVTSIDEIDTTSTPNTAKFSGTARVILSDAYQAMLGMPRIVEDVPFHVHVTEGGAGVGGIQLHIFGMHIPADGVDNTIVSGNIKIQD